MFYITPNLTERIFIIRTGWVLHPEIQDPFESSETKEVFFRNIRFVLNYPYKLEVIHTPIRMSLN